MWLQRSTVKHIMGVIQWLFNEGTGFLVRDAVLIHLLRIQSLSRRDIQTKLGNFGTRRTDLCIRIALV